MYKINISFEKYLNFLVVKNFEYIQVSIILSNSPLLSFDRYTGYKA